MDWNSKRVRALLETALLEDNAARDITTALTIDPTLRAAGTILARQDCVVAGLGSIPVFLEIFAGMSPTPPGRFEVVSHPEIFDGVRVKAGQPLAVIRHNACAILACERAILNLLQRMCGVATLTGEFVAAVRGTKTRILDTRKTIPGLRALDRYAVSCGGGLSHRFDLADGILIKGNHIALCGGLAAALEKALARRGAGRVVMVEARDEEELEQAIQGGAESILLDNMTPEQAKSAVRRIRQTLPEAIVEASGGITLKDARAFALAGVDYLSIGALTHSAPAANLNMRITADMS